MMKIIKNLLALYCLLMLTPALGQTNWVSGYYVTYEGDTVRGLLEFRGRFQNHLLCSFKLNAAAPLQVFRPYEIAGFTFQDRDFYESKVVRELNGNTPKRFVRVIIRAKRSLMQYRNSYYVNDDDNKVYRVSKERIVKGRDVKTDFTGAGQLGILLTGCESINREYISRIYQTAPNFDRLLTNYNLCVGNPMIRSMKPLIKPHLSFGILGGAQSTQLSLRSSLSGAQFSTYVRPIGGVFVSAFFPGFNDHLALTAELTMSNYDQYTAYDYDFSYNDIYIKFNEVIIPVFVRYSFRYLYLDAGIVTHWMWGQQLKWQMTQLYQGELSTAELPMPSVDGAGVGFLVGAGIRIKVLGLTLLPGVRLSNLTHPGARYGPSLQNFEVRLPIQFTR